MPIQRPKRGSGLVTLYHEQKCAGRKLNSQCFLDANHCRTWGRCPVSVYLSIILAHLIIPKTKNLILIGPPSAVGPFVSKKLCGDLLPLVEKLVAFEDSQAATFLLRVSFHFMRTTPLSHWFDVACSFDSA